MIGEGAFDLAFVQKQIAVAENGGEKIIEIMRDAGGELTERVHLLRTAELILKLFAGCHVHQRTDQTFRRAIGCPQNQRAFQNVDVIAIGAAETVFSAPMIGRAG